MTDLNTLSAAELQAVIEKAEKALRERQSSKLKEVLLQIKDLAASIASSSIIFYLAEQPQDFYIMGLNLIEITRCTITLGLKNDKGIIL